MHAFKFSRQRPCKLALTTSSSGAFLSTPNIREASSNDICFAPNAARVPSEATPAFVPSVAAAAEMVTAC